MDKPKRFHATDIVKNLLQWIVVSLLSFVYWAALLLVFSLILLNVWHVTFETIMHISIVLATITAVIYGAVLVKRNL